MHLGQQLPNGPICFSHPHGLHSTYFKIKRIRSMEIYIIPIIINPNISATTKNVHQILQQQLISQHQHFQIQTQIPDTSLSHIVQQW